MSCLEELTLYLHISNRPVFIDGTHLYNDILTYMPRLHTFTFYIQTENDIDGSVLRLSNDDIQRTFINIGYRQVACLVNYHGTFTARCHVFSLPFKFNSLDYMINNFPNIIFNSVTHLTLWDQVPCKHEFFIRVTRYFPPLVKYLSVNNLRPPVWKFLVSLPIDDDWCSIIEYSHVISLDISFVDVDKSSDNPFQYNKAIIERTSVFDILQMLRNEN